MNVKIVVSLVAFILCIANTTHADSPQFRRTALCKLSENLAYDLGRLYQMGRNYNSELESVSPAKSTGLFINYFSEREVQAIMNNHGHAMESEKNKVSDTTDHITTGIITAIVSSLVVALLYWLVKAFRDWKDTKAIIAFLEESKSSTHFTFRSNHAIASAINLGEERVRKLCSRSRKIRRNKKEKESWRLAD